MANLLARLSILRGVATGDAPSNAHLAAIAGLEGEQAVTYHLQCLSREGLVVRQGAKRVATPLAQLLLDYCEAAERGETVYQREMRKHFGGRRYGISGIVSQVAEDLDREYMAKPAAGVWRRTRRGHREPERKATYVELLAALKSCHSLAEVAQTVGLSAGATAQRVAKLMYRSDRAMGRNFEKIEGEQEYA